MAGPALTDVPDRYDVVFQLNDGSTYGFLLADSVESNLPFRTHKALYSYSPTFLERQNVSQQYGDNFQDFFLTGAQADFSEGEQQKFFRVSDVDSVRKYWGGVGINPVNVPGNVTLAGNVTSVTLSTSTCQGLTAGVFANSSWYTADGTNLYKIGPNGTVTSMGAHGLGAVPSEYSLATDGTSVFMSTGGSGKIRAFAESAATFSSFSTTQGADSMCVNNNILFGYSNTNSTLYSFDTSGNATAQFQWKDAAGNAEFGTGQIVAVGGDVYILRSSAYTPATELWQYDGSGCNILAVFPPEFGNASMCVSSGIVFVAGTKQYSSGAINYKAQVYYFANGSVGNLWESQITSGNFAFNRAIAPFGNGVVFYDPGDTDLKVYNIGTGAIYSVASLSLGHTNLHLATNALGQVMALCINNTSAFVWPQSDGTYNSSGKLQTSQYDFDNTLIKIYRGLKVDADIPANTSVDIAYQLDGAGGSYTSLATGITSGTEYALPNNTTGHSLSVQVTLNSATGSATPTLKRVYIRAAPTLQQFRRREFLFDLSSGTRDEIGKVSRRTRDLSPYPVDALSGCTNLAKIATQTIPFTMTDRFTGSTGMTVLADLQQNQEGYDGFAIYEIRPNVFIGRINLREV